jgi:hypothetical protein
MDTYRASDFFLSFFPFFYFFFVSVFLFLFESRSHYATQADLKLVILLPQFLKCWDYRCVTVTG